MAYQVLARKWRPKRFEDVIGQAHITRSLQNAIVRDRLGHAYLLTGTRGIGKTSVARIFAKSLRCESRLDDGNPCLKCPSCKDFESGSSMNFIEIDGASHNSVENVRDLVGNVQYLPTSGRYKIYIIDEVHMLSNSAFNALLKTLEEPPEHVIFILATTEPQKLLETVLSRCQRFDFRNATLQDLMSHVTKIIEKENIKFESEKILAQLCLQGRGSVRDTLSLMDQVLSFATSDVIDEQTVALSLGLARSSVIKKIVENILIGDADRVRELYNSLLSENINVQNIATSLLDHLYETIEFIDDPETLKNKDIVEPEYLESISAAELIWIFESVAKDVTWILETLIPEKSFSLLLQKMSVRRENLQARSGPHGAKKKSESVNTEPPLDPAKDPVERTKLKELNWKEFLDYLNDKSAAMATYIMHGNLIQDVHFSSIQTPIQISLGFSEKDHLMYEYLKESEKVKELKDLLGDFSSRASEDFEVDIKLFKDQEAEEKNFKSVVDIKKMEAAEVEENKRKSFLEHPNVLSAEKIFNSKVDKVKIKK